jgi:hypothetical protein
MSTFREKEINPFVVTGERLVDNYVLHNAMEQRREHFSEAEYPLINPITWWVQKGAAAISGTRTMASETKSFHKTLGIAAVGGFFLLAPMWLMVLYRTLYTALVSTTVFVIFFGFIMARRLRGEAEYFLALRHMQLC